MTPERALLARMVERLKALEARHPFWATKQQKVGYAWCARDFHAWLTAEMAKLEAPAPASAGATDFVCIDCDLSHPESEPCRPAAPTKKGET